MNALEKAADLRHRAEEQIRAIQANTDLTPAARGRRIAEIREKANAEVERLKTAHAKERAAQAVALRRRLFGLSFTAGASEYERHAARQSYRDALFRADALDKPEDAARFFARAQLVGDTLLQKALALVAHERGWHGVVSAYADSSADAASALEELRRAENEAADKRVRLGEAAYFVGIRETEEERLARHAEVVAPTRGTSDDSPRAA